MGSSMCSRPGSQGADCQCICLYRQGSIASLPASYQISMTWLNDSFGAEGFCVYDESPWLRRVTAPTDDQIQGSIMKVAEIKVIKSRRELLNKAKLRRNDFFNDHLILVKDAEIKTDYDFLNVIQAEHYIKKLSTDNNITQITFNFIDGKLEKNRENLLTTLIDNENVLWKTAVEFREIERELLHFTELFFWNQYRIAVSGLTYRFYPTTDEGMHFDTFKKGRPGLFKPGTRAFKVFFNVDKEDRIWRVGPTLQEFCLNMKDDLPNELPTDVNSFCYVVDKLGLLDGVNVQEVAIPPGGMMIANGTMAAHQVVYGNRMVCLESAIKAMDGVPTVPTEQDSYRSIVRKLGLRTTDAFADLEGFHALDGSYERAKKRLENSGAA